MDALSDRFSNSDSVDLLSSLTQRAQRRARTHVERANECVLWLHDIGDGREASGEKVVVVVVVQPEAVRECVRCGFHV